MSESVDMGDLTVRQLLQIYQNPEHIQFKKGQNVSKADLSEQQSQFDQIVSTNPHKNVTALIAEKTELSTIFDNLSDSIDSE